MGCDVHLYVERRVDGRWTSVDRIGREEGDDEANVPYEECYFSDRSYDLFAMLANVRNGRGVAGVATGDGFVPIHDLRGVPEDAAEVYRLEVQRWSDDGHSHSWATVAELLAYDWTRTTRHSGWVDVAEWCVWRSVGKPASWSGGVGGGAVRHVSGERMEQVWMKVRGALGWSDERLPGSYGRADLSVVAVMIADLGVGSHYCEVEWTEPYYASVPRSWWCETVPRLLALGAPQDVRVLYFFDN